MIREKVELKWVSDSLFIESVKDSSQKLIDNDPVKPDNPSIVNSSEIEINKQMTKKSEGTSTVSDDKRIEEKQKDEQQIAFTEPKAITLEQAKILFDKGVLFIDARDEADYKAGFIIKSINIPFDDLKNHQHKLEEISKEKPLVIYCAGTDCDLSILLGNKLFELGYKQVYIFFGGWVEWVNADYPIEHISQ